MPLGALAPDQGRAKNWQDVKPNKEVVKGNYYELLLIQMMGILWNDVGGSFNPVFNLTERSEKNIQIILRKIPQNSSPVKSSTSKREVSSKSAIFDAGRMGPSWTSRITGF